MKVDIFTKTYHKDFYKVKGWLKSIEKYARGFRQVCVVIDDTPEDAAIEWDKMAKESCPSINVIFPKTSNPDNCNGYIWFQIVEFEWELYTDADAIVLYGVDCIFIEPFSPNLFLDENNGKPIYWYQEIKEIRENTNDNYIHIFNQWYKWLVFYLNEKNHQSEYYNLLDLINKHKAGWVTGDNNLSYVSEIVDTYTAISERYDQTQYIDTIEIYQYMWTKESNRIVKQWLADNLNTTWRDFMIKSSSDFMVKYDGTYRIMTYDLHVAEYLLYGNILKFANADTHSFRKISTESTNEFTKKNKWWWFQLDCLELENMNEDEYITECNTLINGNCDDKILDAKKRRANRLSHINKIN